MVDKAKKELSFRIAETAREALKRIVSRGRPPIPAFYSEEFRQVAQEKGYHELLDLLNDPKCFKEEDFPYIVVQAGAILEAAKEILIDLGQSTTERVEAMEESLGKMEAAVPIEDFEAIVKEVDTLRSHNQALKAEVEQARGVIEDQTQEIERLRENIRIDYLTALLNRRALDEELKDEVLRAKRYGFELSVAMLDIDHFKHINDTYGHAIGDEVLKTVARLLKENVREVDRLYRYGGEEFLLLMPHTHCRDALKVCERLIKKVGDHLFSFPNRGFSFRITLSAGIAELEKEDTPESLLERADATLYAAKIKGRNKACGCLYSDRGDK
ncbi:diguanylate cyclase [Thermosulfuriphilus sp.]